MHKITDIKDYTHNIHKYIALYWIYYDAKINTVKSVSFVNI